MGNKRAVAVCSRNNLERLKRLIYINIALLTKLAWFKYQARPEYLYRDKLENEVPNLSGGFDGEREIV